MECRNLVLDMGRFVVGREIGWHCDAASDVDGR